MSIRPREFIEGHLCSLTCLALKGLWPTGSGIEPLLEDIGDLDLRDIHWVIVGGESGHKARERLNNPPKQQTSSNPALQTRSDARTHRISAKKPLSMRLLAHFSAISGQLGALIPAPLATDCDAPSICWIGQTG